MIFPRFFCNYLIVKALDNGLKDASAPVPPLRCASPMRKESVMLWTIAVILVVLWALGLASAYTLGGFIHVLLVIAVIVVVVRLIQGRSVV
jgi:Family of unknown function (DUF5670)